jgi:uncharacterized coiled-coil DUF342 family protein
MGKRLDQCG